MICARARIGIDNIRRLHDTGGTRRLRRVGVIRERGGRNHRCRQRHRDHQGYQFLEEARSGLMVLGLTTQYAACTPCARDRLRSSDHIRNLSVQGLKTNEYSDFDAARYPLSSAAPPVLYGCWYSEGFSPSFPLVPRKHPETNGFARSIVFGQFFYLCAVIVCTAPPILRHNLLSRSAFYQTQRRLPRSNALFSRHKPPTQSDQAPNS